MGISTPVCVNQQKTNDLKSVFKTEATEEAVSKWELSRYLFFSWSFVLLSEQRIPRVFPTIYSHLAEQIVFVWLCAHISCVWDALNRSYKQGLCPGPRVPFLLSLWAFCLSHPGNEVSHLGLSPQHILMGRGAEERAKSSKAGLTPSFSWHAPPVACNPSSNHEPQMRTFILFKPWFIFLGWGPGVSVWKASSMQRVVNVVQRKNKKLPSRPDCGVSHILTLNTKSSGKKKINKSNSVEISEVANGDSGTCYHHLDVCALPRLQLKLDLQCCTLMYVEVEPLRWEVVRVSPRDSNYKKRKNQGKLLQLATWRSGFAMLDAARLL